MEEEGRENKAEESPSYLLRHYAQARLGKQ